MKTYRSLMEILIIIGLFIWIGSAGAVQAASTEPAAAETAKVMEAGAGYLENITFEKLKGKERVVLMLSRQSGATAEDQGEKTIAVKIENLFIPQDLCRAMGEGSLDNLIRVVPAQRTAGGKPQALIGIELNRRVPYSVRQDGHNVIIDFNVASLPVVPAGTGAGAKPAPKEQAKFKAAVPAQKPPAQPNVVPPSYAGRLVSLDFQDASIKSVLQLLAEESGVNIVSGEDVKGNITVSMKKVPWEQALDTILAITGMVKTQQGNTITVMTMDRMRKNEKDLKDAEKERRDGVQARKDEEQKQKESEGKKRQIVIEAKILEATDDFARKFGVQWGAGFADSLRVGKGSYPYGILAGASPIGGTPFGALKGLAQGVALSTTNLAANFPMAASAPSYALGLSLGSSYALLDAEIVASEKTSDVRIISSPKVTTMDGAKAVIKQGEDVPVVTPATAQSPATVSFKEAVLKLEVTPIITQAGKISMSVKANNDWADYARATQLQGNPPINKSEVDSKVVLNDGETMVIGGILKVTTSKGQSGLPWISKVPILGWLFKYDELSKNRKQLLIFITPRIVKDEKPANGLEGQQPDNKPKG
ncbi:MAG: secretin and TonB N-terminal domain-containing protein [Pseudomonadota bacterium]